MRLAIALTLARAPALLGLQGLAHLGLEGGLYDRPHHRPQIVGVVRQQGFHIVQGGNKQSGAGWPT